jgi:C-terminal peptidase prc
MNTKKPSNAKILSAAILCLVLVLIPPGSPRVSATRDGGSDHASTNTAQGRLAVFDDVWQTIKDRYYDPSIKGIDWDASRSAYRQAAAEAGGSEQFYEILRRMLETLNDPHTRVYSPDKKSDWWQPRFVTVGLTVREIEGVPIVVQVEPSSAPARAGIKPGDEIESVDGLPAAQMILERLNRRSAVTANESARARTVSSLLDGEPETVVSLRWKEKGGRLKSASFRRYLSQRRLGFEISSRDKFLVVEVETFTPALVLDLVKELSHRLTKARGVILDLRNNGGGDAQAMASFAAVFLGGGVGLGTFTDRVGSTFTLITYSTAMFVSTQVNKSDLPLIVLVSERTSSAAEILASALQVKRQAKIIGVPTCGCVLAIRARHVLPDNGALDVSEFDYRTAEGTRLEGIGVRPDRTIGALRRDLYGRRDRTLDTGLAQLKTKSTASFGR